MKIKTLVTADDFGFSQNINRAIFDVHEKGSVTELSLMVDSYGTDEAVAYIRKHQLEHVGLHFSLCRVARDRKMIHGNEYEPVLRDWSPEQLHQAFDEEVALFVEKVGYTPRHVIGHKQIALHDKLREYISAYCRKHDSYARRYVTHPTLVGEAPEDQQQLGRVVDRVLTFQYGSPEEMYVVYKSQVQAASKSGVKSIEFVFHPGYPGEFERNLTSFIEERKNDASFLLSQWFQKLISEEELQLVTSDEIM